VDQGIVSPTTAGHYVRLALILCASVLGLIVLGFVFGSSSASADDGGPDDGGLVPVAADAAGGVVETIAPIITPMTAAIPLADVPLSPAATTLTMVTTIAPIAGDVLGPTPAGLVVGTLVKSVDSAVETLTGVVGPVLNLLPVLTTVTHAVDVTAASGVSTAAGALLGSADGLWQDLKGPFGTGAVSAAGPAVSNLTLPAAALGAGFVVLLFSRRLGLGNSAVPVSPVYETDTSPD
jgi:hypothetical protein